MSTPDSAPLNTIDEAAIATHEVFSAYVRAGFTREEALELVAQTIASSLERGQP